MSDAKYEYLKQTVSWEVSAEYSLVYIMWHLKRPEAILGNECKCKTESDKNKPLYVF